MLGRRLLRASIGVIIAILMAPRGTPETIRLPVKQRGSAPLFQIHYGKKWGYMDWQGKTVISPQFDDEGDFFGGLAKVRKGRKWGYVDQAGHLAIPYQFDGAGDFKEGLAPAQAGHRWGFINAASKFVIEPQFQAVFEFSDGLALFEIWDTIECPDGTFTKDNAPLYALPLHGTWAAEFGGCFAPYARYGYVDKRAKIVIAPVFVVANSFSEGLAAVRLDQAAAPKYEYIDKTGKTVIGPRFDQALSFSEGLAAAQVGFRAEDGKQIAGRWGFIDHSGRFAIRPEFDLAASFSEGLAAVAPQLGIWGFVDKRGKLAIPAKYAEAGPFSEGLAFVQPLEEENGYYVDKTGRKALELKLAEWPFSDGLTVAGMMNERKYVDRMGTVVAPYEVDPYY